MKEKEEVVLTDEEKMKKKFGKYKKIMTVIKHILMIAPIVIIVSAVIIGLMIGNIEKLEESNLIVGELQEGEKLDWRAEVLDVLDMKDELEDYEDESETTKTLMVISLIVVVVAEYVLVIIMVDYLAKIFGEVETNGTPFTENNIKFLKKVHILSIVLWALQTVGVKEYSVGLIFVLVISAFRSVFEHGYKLQKESDETL